jgi:hypothetical protein
MSILSVNVPVRTSQGRLISGQEIKVVKQPQSAIIPSRRETVLKCIGDMQNELGRMQKLLDELRADVLHLTVE